MTEALLTVKQTAQLLCVSQCWVRRHRHRLGAIYLGRSLRFNQPDVEKLCTSPTSQFIVSPAERSLKPKPSGYQPQEKNMLQRNRYQRGSVYKMGKRVKVWYGMYRTDQLNSEGSVVRRQRSVRLGNVAEIPTKHAAMEALRKAMGVNSKPAVRMTFAELVDRWKAVQVPAMKSSTAQHYQNALRGVMPTFQAAEVNAITRHDVERFIQDRARIYSRSTLRSLRTTLSLVLGYAVANSWLEKNPVTGIKLPRAENCGGKPLTRCALTVAQVMALVNALEEPYATLVLVLAATGLRIGECAGLRWPDLVGNVLHVTRRVYCGAVDDLKTKGSRRKLPLSPEIANRLLALCGSDADSWIFPASNGAPLNPGNWLRREIRPAGRKLGIALTGWHDFRHFFSTQLRRAGTHPKLVSNLLGHSNVHLALNVYDHVEVGELVAPVERMSAQLLCDVIKSEVSC